MALFQRVTKTSVWATMGFISFKPFIADKKEKALIISLLDENGKKHSITLYGDEVDQLRYIINKPICNPSLKIWCKECSAAPVEKEGMICNRCEAARNQ